jgi:hypothetical protein
LPFFKKGKYFLFDLHGDGKVLKEGVEYICLRRVRGRGRRKGGRAGGRSGGEGEGEGEEKEMREEGWALESPCFSNFILEGENLPYKKIRSRKPTCTRILFPSPGGYAVLIARGSRAGLSNPRQLNKGKKRNNEKKRLLATPNRENFKYFQ